MSIVIELLGDIAGTFVAMAPYLLLGLTFAGILHVVFSRALIMRHLGAGSLGSVVKAALLGVPLPLCSCGVIPTALSLRKSRASEGATLSFLISTPQTGIDSIIATYGLLGPVFAVFRPFAALVMGIVGGLSANLFEPRGSAGETSSDGRGPDCTICPLERPHSHTPWERLRAMATYAYGEFLDDIALQLVVGIAISGAIAFAVPPAFFERAIGNELLAMGLMILGGIPLYVCATASIPIAAALMLKGLSPGAAFVFLAVGPATNAATITLIVNAMGKRIAAIYLGVIAACSIGAGFALNAVYELTGAAPALQAAVMHDEPGFWKLAIAGVFAALLARSLIARFFGSKKCGGRCSCEGDACSQAPQDA
jgi:uncharacterized membrane protein YraQ (UPF0718 family)